jgi:hypothetical protein
MEIGAFDVKTLLCNVLGVANEASPGAPYILVYIGPAWSDVFFLDVVMEQIPATLTLA